MRRSLPGSVLLSISALCLILNSCLEVACIDETEAYAKASFYSYSTKNSIIPDSITLYGINMQTNKIYNKAKITPPALLPLNDTTYTSIFIIRINGITDTIDIRAYSYPHLVTKECGYSMFHFIYAIFHTKNSIDSIHIRNENVTTSNVENLSIYY